MPEETLEQIVPTDDSSVETKELGTEEVVEPVEETVEPTVEPVEPELDPNIYDEDGVPWKNRASEYKKKYTKQLEQAQEPQKVVEDSDPRLQEVKLDSISEAEWEDIEEKRGISRHEIVRIHNAEVKALKLEQKLNNMESKGILDGVLASVDSQYHDEVKKYITALGVDRSNAEAVRMAVDTKLQTLQTPETAKEIAERTKRQMEQNKQIVSKQPSPTPPKQTEIKKIEISAEEQKVAKLNNMTDEEYVAERDKGKQIG
jgi:hypothetical protein